MLSEGRSGTRQPTWAVSDVTTGRQPPLAAQAFVSCRHPSPYTMASYDTERRSAPGPDQLHPLQPRHPPMSYRLLVLLIRWLPDDLLGEQH